MDNSSYKMKIATAIFLPLLISACASSPLLDKNEDEIPDWLGERIEIFQRVPLKNPPVEITQWTFNGNRVYYISTYCCDIFSELYSDGGDLLCHPDGGITGKGDGRCTEFFDERADMRLIWQDSRK